ncbi:MAG TPA: hypothetical protein VF761_16940 [Gemmatimonadaceae bacterium]
MTPSPYVNPTPRYSRRRRLLDALIVVVCEIALLALAQPTGGWKWLIFAAAAFYLAMQALRAPVWWAKWVALVDEANAIARNAVDAHAATLDTVQKTMATLRSAISPGATWTNIRVHVSRVPTGPKFILCTTATDEPDPETCALCATGSTCVGVAWPVRSGQGGRIEEYPELGATR